MLVTEHAFSTLNVLRLFALPFADNAGSIRVLEKAGYAREGMLRSSSVKNGCRATRCSTRASTRLAEACEHRATMRKARRPRDLFRLPEVPAIVCRDDPETGSDAHLHDERKGFVYVARLTSSSRIGDQFTDPSCAS